MISLNKVNCPCGGIAPLKHEPRELTIHKVGKQVFEFYYYECDDCGGLWTTTETDTISYEKLDFTENE